MSKKILSDKINVNIMVHTLIGSCHFWSFRNATLSSEIIIHIMYFDTFEVMIVMYVYTRGTDRGALLKSVFVNQSLMAYSLDLDAELGHI